MPASLLIQNGTLIDPTAGIHRRADLFIQDGHIQTLQSAPPADTVNWDASGCLVCPGFVDMHVHLRQPGFEHKETIASGLRAAARGGFTAVAPMPNTRPVCDSPQVLRQVLNWAAEAAMIPLLPICAITRDMEGTELAPYTQLASMQCRAFSNDGRPVADAGTMRRAMTAILQVGGLVIDHCEDPSLTDGGVMHSGGRAAGWGLPGLSPLAEEVHIARDILLAEEVGCPVHIAHLSTARGLDLIRWAKDRGAPVTAEVSPHHLLLSVEDLTWPDPDFKMNPPLRSRQDRAALLAGLRDGSIDVVATDHAPHTREEKAAGFAAAPFGVVGLETAIPLLLDQFLHRGELSIERICEVCAVAPARLMGAPARGLTPGHAANLTILDPNAETVVDRSSFASRSSNTPFAGWRLRGSVRAIVVGGRLLPTASI